MSIQPQRPYRDPQDFSEPYLLPSVPYLTVASDLGVQENICNSGRLRFITIPKAFRNCIVQIKTVQVNTRPSYAETQTTVW